MAKLIPKKTIKQIKLLRQKGYSLPEIKNKLNVGYGSVFRYIKNVKILPHFQKSWFGKRGGSLKRKKIALDLAKAKAEALINKLSDKEKIIFLTAIYWGEGNKSDFNVINSDPLMISVLIQGLIRLFKVPLEDIRISLRIYEDLDKNFCLKFWSETTGIAVNNFQSVIVLQGNKKGKLPYGMCRIRVKKGGDLLKYLKAVRNRVVSLFP